MNLKRLSLVFALAAALLAASGCSAGVPEAPAAPTESGPVAGPATPIENAAPLPFPADTLVLVWHREGGIAGFCDDLSVYADGSFRATTCVALPESERTGRLDAGQMRQLAYWVNTFQSFDTSEGEGATYPDAMILKTTFRGAGTTQAGPEVTVEISNFASLLVAQPAPAADGNPPQAVAKARDFLAGALQIPAGEVVVVSFEFVEWPDSCLGVDAIDQMCAQVVTPGYQVVLQAGGRLYELHTDESGESIRRVP